MAEKPTNGNGKQYPKTAELSQAFSRIRDLATKAATNKGRGNLTEISETETLELVAIAAFLGESLFVNVGRIADSLEKIANVQGVRMERELDRLRDQIESVDEPAAR